MSNQTQDIRDIEPEYGSDDWAVRRGYEIATAFDCAWDDQMQQADDIAAAFMELRDTYEQRLAAVVAERDELYRELSDVMVWGQACDDVRSEVAHERDQLRQRVAELEQAQPAAMPDDVSEIIITVLEDERDRHIINGGLASNRKEIETALAWLTSAQGRSRHE